MKCISLIQPWASLIVFGEKLYETRSWQTKYRGPLLIHASGKIPTLARDLCEQEPFKSILEKHGIRNWGDLPTGKLIGAVNLSSIVATTELIPDDVERHFGDFRPGRYAWRVTDALCFEAQPLLRGSLGIFDVCESVIPEQYQHIVIPTPEHRE